jgi:pyruvate formate lyase activating enzyme
VWNDGGRLVRSGGTDEQGVLEWYYDSLPTNCVSWWFCPGCTGSGYPKYAYKPGAEYGYSNLAVFYGACSFDCLFCQNWHYRNLPVKRKPGMSAEALAFKADKHVSCMCYFGGDPSPQLPHSLEVSRIALEKARVERRILRICWETNGYMNSKLAEQAAEYALESGGNIKFDLKAWSEEVNIALCGVSNEPTLANFKMIGEKFYWKRRELPVLSASTLLIPGYVDVEEVKNVAKFISEIDQNIPYTLLAFYPCYVMDDLPTTSKKQAAECQKAAEKFLKNVRIGNIHLLS